MATGVPSKRRSQNVAYSLQYDGKKASLDVLAEPGAEPQEIVVSSDAGHLYQGENLSTLLWLGKHKNLRGKVRSIYIDPPYATSRAFIDRDTRHAYDDHVCGAEYLEALRQRLLVLHDLLASDGSIFVHLDQNMVFEAKIILDEVFGRENFRNFITRKKCNTKNYTRKNFGNISDHVLFYSKSDENVWHRPYDAWSDEKIKDEYPCIDEESGRRYKKVPVHAPGVRQGETGKAWRGKLPPTGKHWQYTPQRLDEMDAAGEIYWSPNGNPRRKVFFDQSQGIPAQDIWMDFKDAHNQNIQITGYPTEKNFDLVRRLIAATTNPGDLVLDCYCGSGTTLEAAASLGRKFIGIDISSAAIDATVKRFIHGRSAMGDFVGVRHKKSRRSPSETLFPID
jgi:adenine-specific DNA-methyltransferase